MIDAYRSGSHNDAGSLRIKENILRALYNDHFDADDVATLVNEVVACCDNAPAGTLWSLRDRLPQANLPQILDKIAPAKKKKSRRNSWEGASFFEAILLRVLNDTGMTLDAARVLKWLRTLHSFRGEYSTSRSNELSAALKAWPTLLRQLASRVLKAADDANWSIFYRFHQMTWGSVSLGFAL